MGEFGGGQPNASASRRSPVLRPRLRRRESKCCSVASNVSSGLAAQRDRKDTAPGLTTEVTPPVVETATPG